MKKQLLANDISPPPRTDQLDFVVCARIRTVAQFENNNQKVFQQLFAPRQTTEKPIVGAQVFIKTLCL
jgi:hypothetical protein